MWNKRQQRAKKKKRKKKKHKLGSAALTRNEAKSMSTRLLAGESFAIFQVKSRAFLCVNKKQLPLYHWRGLRRANETEAVAYSALWTLLLSSECWELPTPCWGGSSGLPVRSLPARATGVKRERRRQLPPRRFSVKASPMALYGFSKHWDA